MMYKHEIYIVLEVKSGEEFLRISFIQIKKKLYFVPKLLITSLKNQIYRKMESRTFVFLNIMNEVNEKLSII